MKANLKGTERINQLDEKQKKRERGNEKKSLGEVGRGEGWGGEGDARKLEEGFFSLRKVSGKYNHSFRQHHAELDSQNYRILCKSQNIFLTIYRKCTP